MAKFQAAKQFLVIYRRGKQEAKMIQIRKKCSNLTKVAEIKKKCFYKRFRWERSRSGIGFGVDRN